MARPTPDELDPSNDLPLEQCENPDAVFYSSQGTLGEKAARLREFLDGSEEGHDMSARGKLQMIARVGGFGEERWPEPPLAKRVAEHDRAVGQAALDAAARVAPRGAGFLERFLQEALVPPLGFFMPGCEVTGPRGVEVPGWDPQPGPVDLLVCPLNEPASTIAAELKVDDVDQVLWDLVKLAALARRPEIERCYLIYAAPARTWKRASCTGLFAPAAPPAIGTVWSTQRMFWDWERQWARLLRGGTARPREVPALIYTLPLGAAPVPAHTGYELRVVAVVPVGDGIVAFDGDWPRGHPMTSGVSARNVEQVTTRDLIDAETEERMHRDAREERHRQIYRGGSAER